VFIIVAFNRSPETRRAHALN